MTPNSDRKIWIYGNPDKSELGFPMPGDLTKYLQGDIFTKEKGRYRYTQGKNAEVIILSRDGLAFGHFEIEEKVKPNDADRAAYPKVRFVYIVRNSYLYNQPVLLSQLSITVRQYGHKLSESEFQELLNLANGVVEYRSHVPITEEVPSAQKYYEGAVRTVLVNAYERSRDARAACLAHYGMTCAACGFTMADLYGHAGEGVIHVHHLYNLAKVGEQYEVDPINDLRPVCPNCHAILHTVSPAMSVEDLRALLASQNPIQWPMILK